VWLTGAFRVRRDTTKGLAAANFIETGEIVWEVPQPGPARAKTSSAVLATAGGLIFYGQPNGGFMAVDQRNGKRCGNSRPTFA